MPKIPLAPNPNLNFDIKRLLELVMDENEINKHIKQIDEVKPTDYEKLTSFIEKMKLVEFLEHEKNLVSKNKFRYHGFNVNEVVKNLNILILYLNLTCIDIFASTMPYLTFEEWICDNSGDFSNDISFSDYIKQKSKMYKKEYGVSSNFIKAFVNAPEHMRTNLTKYLTVQIGDVSYKDIEKIADFLKNIRNKYTHEGHRVYFSPSSVVEQKIIIGARIRNQKVENRSERSLLISPSQEFDLISAIHNIAIHQCKKVLKFQS